MQTDIYYRDITKTENLEDYLLDKVESSLGDFLKYDSGAHLTVRVAQDRHRTQLRKPSYLCELLLKTSRSKSVIKVIKADENFKTCVTSAVNALRARVAKVSAIKKEHRRYDPALTQSYQQDSFVSEEIATA